MELQKERPPYVTFEVRAVKDEAASIEAGRAVYEDVDFALIMPIGGKDKVEREVDGWLASVAAQVQEDRLPAAWENHFRAIYQAWKAGQEIPTNGLSVKMWPMATPSDVASLIAANVLTVEDLAAANEATLLRIGMGSRTLKSKAEAYIRSADQGKVAEAFADLAAKHEAQTLRIEALERENKVLQQQLTTKAKAA